MVKKAAQATPNLLLRTARKERGWTQKQVADRIGAPLSLNISRWEKGTAFPSAYYLEKLCHLFGKNARELGLSQLAGETQDEIFAPDESGQLRSAPDAGPRPWTLPFPRNPFFLGREELLARLRRQFLASQTVDLSQPQAMSGLGGIGKTQIALEYAYRYAQDYQAVFWVRADSRDTLAAGLLEIARAVNLPERDERDQTAIVAAVKAWLSQHSGWLLILDNADDLTLLPDFLPAPTRGHLLLTTRAQALGGLAHRIEVHVLDQDAATLLVLRRAGLLAPDALLAEARQDEQQGGAELSRQLGGLPLALDQAGAYLEETACGLQHYLELYKSHRAELLHHRGGWMLDHPDSIATTWSLSFASIEQRSAVAADILRVCALLHPDAIPEELFLQGAAHLGPALAAIETDPLGFNNALAIIQNYSLLRRSSQERTLSMHRVVQAVLTDRMTRQERDQWIDRVIATLNVLFPEVRNQGWEQWSQCGRLLPHALTITATAQQHNLELASLLTKMADYLLQRAQYQQAEPLYQRALSLYDERMPNYEHPQVAFPLNGLADLYRELGHYEQAEPLYQRALRFWEQANDSRQTEIPSPLNNLAILYQEQGRHEQAEQLLLQALSFDEQIFGPEHPAIASLLNNLAIIYGEQGRLEQAKQLLLRALRLDEQQFGPEHPEVAFSLTNLADLYLKQGRYEQAEPLYQRALSIREQMLGSEHPQVAFPLHGLATLYREQGRFEQAEPLYRRTLAIRQQQRGVRHPETAETLHEFAHLHELRNQPEEALALYQQALAIREQLLGMAHPRTLATRERYAHLSKVHGQVHIQPQTGR